MTIQAIVTDASIATVADSFEVATNEDWVRAYQLVRDDDPFPIQMGWTLYLQMVGSDGVLSLNASSDNQKIVITDRGAGKFALRVKTADSSQVTPDTYSYDVLLVAGEDVYRVAKGKITVEQGITVVPGQETWSHHALISRP